MIPKRLSRLSVPDLPRPDYPKQGVLPREMPVRRSLADPDLLADKPVGPDLYLDPGSVPVLWLLHTLVRPPPRTLPGGSPFPKAPLVLLPPYSHPGPSVGSLPPEPLPQSLGNVWTSPPRILDGRWTSTGDPSVSQLLNPIQEDRYVRNSIYTNRGKLPTPLTPNLSPSPNRFSTSGGTSSTLSLRPTRLESEWGSE